MLRKFSVSGFKTIRRAELEFGRVNLFIGGNGAGKSNLLEALGILSSGLKDISDIELQKRGVRLSVPTLFKSALRNTRLRATLDLEGTFENHVQYNLLIKAGLSVEGLRFFSENIKFKGESLMGRSPNGVRIRGISAPKKDIDPARGLWDRFREAVEIPSEVEVELERMSRYAIFAPQTAFLRGTEVEAIPVEPMGLQGGGLAQAAQALMAHFFRPGRDLVQQKLVRRALEVVHEPGWSQAFRIRSFDSGTTTRLVRTGTSSLYFVDRFMNTNRNILSAYDSSEGSLYLLFIVVLLLHPRAPKIFALDNVDNALNPAITKKLLEIVIECTCKENFRTAQIGPDQVFLTSHNPTSLDAFDIFDPAQRVFVVARESSGASTIKRLQPPQGATRADWIKQAGGKSLSELWIEGKIKGALG